MRIGIVTQSYFPVRGGIPELVYHQALELEKLGHIVTIITARFSPFDEDRNTDVVRVGRDVTLPLNGSFVNITVGLNLKEKLRQIERQKHFDIVHLHQPLDLFLPATALQAFSCPMVGTFHTYRETGRLDYDVLKPWYHSLWKRLAARIVVSPSAQETISSYFPGAYEVIPNGVDTERFRPELPPINRFADGRPNILFVGRMDPRKGLRYLLEAFPVVSDRFPEARLIVVGNGILRHYYQMKLDPRYHDRVHYEGFVSSAALPRYFSMADIYCSPATGGESFGIVLLEAMASGTPIVASDIAGYHDVVTNGKEGILVPPRSPHHLAESLTELLSNPAKCKAMGQAGRKSAEHYAWDRVTAQIEAVYKRVLGSRS